MYIFSLLKVFLKYINIIYYLNNKITDKILFI